MNATRHSRTSGRVNEPDSTGTNPDSAHPTRGHAEASASSREDTRRISHDQNFKNLIVQYPRDALKLFAPEEADVIDRWVRITPIRQEQLVEKPGSRFFELDVSLLLEWPDGRREALVFVVEHESTPGNFSVSRLATYCLAVSELQNTTRVIPVVIFMRDATGVPRSLSLGSERRTYLQFEYIACELPQLQATAFFTTDNVVAALMMPLMHHAREHRVQVYGEALRRFLRLERKPGRRRKYIDFIDIYADLDEDEQREYAERYAEEGTEMAGMRERFTREGEERGFEKGIQQGLVQGVEKGVLQGQQLLLARMLAERFGPLDAATESRLAAASPDELMHWSLRLLAAQSLDEVFRLQ